MADDLTEKQISTSLVYEGAFLKVRKDRVRMPDGSESGREYVEHPGAAAMVPLFDDGRVLIERQFRYPLRREFIEIPAGKIDAGETSLQTAQRELSEHAAGLAVDLAQARLKTDMTAADHTRLVERYVQQVKE